MFCFAFSFHINTQTSLINGTFLQNEGLFAKKIVKLGGFILEILSNQCLGDLKSVTSSADLSMTSRLNLTIALC